MTRRTILLERSSTGWLQPYDAASAEHLAGWKPGNVLEVNVRYIRSPEHHRFTMALIHKLWQAGVIEAESMDAAIEVCKLVVGYVEPRQLPDGSVHVVPRSISYAAADEETYRKEFAAPLRQWAAGYLDMSDAQVVAEFGGLV